MTDPSRRRLVLLRHGRTAWNHEGRIQGQSDVGLDDVGHAQAADVAPLMVAHATVRLWSSDLRRTRETTAPAAAATGLTPTYDARLRELSFGDLEGLSHAELRASDPAAYAAIRRGSYEEIPSAEDPVAAVARMTEVLGEVWDALETGETALVVSHGAVIRLAVAALLGWPVGVHRTLRHLDNCAWATLAEHPDSGVLQLVRWNRTAGDEPL